MCVSGVRSGAVSCERVCVSCEWASRRSSVVRREVFLFALRFVRDSEVFVSCFEFGFSCRILKSISRILEVVFWSRISNSTFSFRSSIRLLESDFEIRRRIRLLECRVEFQIRMRRRNFSSKFSFRCSIRLLEFRCSIRLLEFRCSIRLLEFRCSIRLLDSSPLNLMIRNCRRISNSSWSIRLLERRFELSSKLLFARRVLSLSS